jgi:hypothetical protein
MYGDINRTCGKTCVWICMKLSNYEIRESGNCGNIIRCENLINYLLYDDLHTIPYEVRPAQVLPSSKSSTSLTVNLVQLYKINVIICFSFCCMSYTYLFV